MKKTLAIGLLLALSGCSWFQRVEPLQVQYDLQKEDRAKPAAIACDCDDPDPLSLGRPDIKKTRDGWVDISNPDYEVLADNQQRRLKWHRDGREYKKCMLRCIEKYNKYLEELGR